MRIFVVMFFTLFTIGAIAQDTKSAAQAAPADTRLPCQKNTNLPAFNITLEDTITIFNTSKIKEGKKSVFVIFGPDCSHCKDFFRRLFMNIDTVKNADFYLVTPIRNYSAFTRFYYEFNLNAHENIKAAGRDLDFFAMDFFGVRQFPAVYIYDERKKLVGGVNPENVLEELQNK